jgi:Cu(I)-responsive transcriptional regulator
MKPMVSIKEAALNSGLPAKTIRYYEQIGLVLPKRSDNGYRAFDDADVHKLRFLSRARGLGFSVEDCRRLLALYDNNHRASADVKALAQQHVTEIDTKIEELRSMRHTLNHLIHTCAGDDRPDCPILNNLALGKDI